MNYLQRKPGDPDDHERRDLREKILGHVTYLFGDANITFEREEVVGGIIKTSDAFYDWVVKEPE